MARPGRLAALDSLRGLLALSVFLFHIVLVYDKGIVSDNPAPPTSLAEWVLNNSPLRIFWSGHQAVVGFFVLSGFVLTLSFAGLRRADFFEGAWLRFVLAGSLDSIPHTWSPFHRRSSRSGSPMAPST
jgi:peptidoglycan/LPS O-acetylase OafA/YrhL